MRYRLLVCSTLLLAAAWANADDTPAIQQVQVSAGGADQRQRDTTAVIVVGHDELIRQGDSMLADALKRLPGVSIAGVQGQGGEIRLHGLGNGYTQIMLNGVPVPTGFSLDSIAPELIERVEIMRAATAESSNQALAGSINIVLRKSVAAGRREWRAGISDKNGQRSPTLSTQLSDRAGDFNYTLAATLTRLRSATPTVDWDEQRDAHDQLELLRRTPQTDAGHDDALVIAPRLSWKLADGATLTSQNYVNLRRLDHHHVANETDFAGAPSDFRTASRTTPPTARCCAAISIGTSRWPTLPRWRSSWPPAAAGAAPRSASTAATSTSSRPAATTSLPARPKTASRRAAATACRWAYRRRWPSAGTAAARCAASIGANNSMRRTARCSTPATPAIRPWCGAWRCTRRMNGSSRGAGRCTPACVGRRSTPSAPAWHRRRSPPAPACGARPYRRSTNSVSATSCAWR